MPGTHGARLSRSLMVPWYRHEGPLCQQVAPREIGLDQALILAGLIQGCAREDVLALSWPPLLRLREIHPPHPEVNAVAKDNFREKQPPKTVGRGYVVKTLEVALWAFHDAKDFREAVLPGRMSLS
jgi:hypothetical protein